MWRKTWVITRNYLFSLKPLFYRPIIIRHEFNYSEHRICTAESPKSCSIETLILVDAKLQENCTLCFSWRPEATQLLVQGTWSGMWGLQTLKTQLFSSILPSVPSLPVASRWSSSLILPPKPQKISGSVISISDIPFTFTEVYCFRSSWS